MELLVIYRLCNVSNISINKKRPSFYDKEKCLLNIIKTCSNFKKIKFLVLFDGIIPSDHFINKYKNNIEVININANSGSKSYINAIDTAIKTNYKYVYLIEDDYLHRKNWDIILLEGLKTNCSYVTLYDHNDKYNLNMYPNLTSKIFYTKSIFWRTIPSTTDTFACKISTLKEDLQVHKKYSSNTTFSQDHLRFLHLGKLGRTIVSCLPGWSTHLEVPYISPLYDWSKEIYD